MGQASSRNSRVIALAAPTEGTGQLIELWSGGLLRLWACCAAGNCFESAELALQASGCALAYNLSSQGASVPICSVCVPSPRVGSEAATTQLTDVCLACSFAHHNWCRQHQQHVCCAVLHPYYNHHATGRCVCVSFMRCTLSAGKHPASRSHSTTLLLADLSSTLLHRGAQGATVLQNKQEGKATPENTIQKHTATRAPHHHHYHPTTAADAVLLAGPRMLTT